MNRDQHVGGFSTAGALESRRVHTSTDAGGVGIVDFLALLANWGQCP